MQYVHEGGTNKLLAQYSWDALSRAQSIAYGDGTSDAYSQYDAGDNLQTLTQTFNGSNSSAAFNYTWLMNLSVRATHSVPSPRLVLHWSYERSGSEAQTT